MGNRTDIQYMPLFKPTASGDSQFEKYQEKEALLTLVSRTIVTKDTGLPYSGELQLMYKYTFQVTKDVNEDIFLYAMNLGNLGYLTSTDVAADQYRLGEDVLEFEPKTSEWVNFLPNDIHKFVKKFYFGNLDTTAVRTALIDNVLKEDFFQWVWYRVRDLFAEIPSDDEAVVEYHNQFVAGAETVTVKAGEHIGAIATDPSDGTKYLLNLYVLCQFDIDSEGFAVDDEVIRIFFDSCRHAPGKQAHNFSHLAGHPIIAKICETLSATGRVDVVNLTSGAFNKYTNIEIGGDYLPIDFDRFYPTVVLQEHLSLASPTPDAKLNDFLTDYGSVNIGIYNPDGRTLQISGSDTIVSGTTDFDISTLNILDLVTFDGSYTIFTISSKSDSAFAGKHEYELYVHEYTTIPSTLLLKIKVLQLPLKTKAIKLWALTGGTAPTISTDLVISEVSDETEVKAFFGELNEILGKQSNLFIFPETVSPAEPSFFDGDFGVRHLDIPLPQFGEVFFAEKPRGTDSPELIAINAAMAAEGTFNFIFSFPFTRDNLTNASLSWLWDPLPCDTDQKWGYIMDAAKRVTPAELTTINTLVTSDAVKTAMAAHGFNASAFSINVDFNTTTGAAGLTVLQGALTYTLIQTGRSTIKITFIHEFLHQFFDVVLGKPDFSVIPVNDGIHFTHDLQADLKNISDTSLPNNVLNETLESNPDPNKGECDKSGTVSFWQIPAPSLEQYKITSRQAEFLNDNF